MKVSGEASMRAYRKSESVALHIAMTECDGLEGRLVDAAGKGRAVVLSGVNPYMARVALKNGPREQWLSGEETSLVCEGLPGASAGLKAFIEPLGDHEALLFFDQPLEPAPLRVSGRLHLGEADDEHAGVGEFGAG